jgi:hypothetical protein
VKEFGNGMVCNGRGKIEKEKLKVGRGFNHRRLWWGGGGEEFRF